MPDRYRNTINVLAEIMDERADQDRKWGEQNHPLHDPQSPTGLALLGHSYAQLEEIMKARFEAERSGAVILLEEVFEALAARDVSDARAELIQVAAVAVMIVEGIDRARPCVPVCGARGCTPDYCPGGKPCVVHTGTHGPTGWIPADRVAADFRADPADAERLAVGLDAEVISPPYVPDMIKHLSHDHGDGPRPCLCGATGQAARCTTPETHGAGCACPPEVVDCYAEDSQVGPGQRRCWSLADHPPHDQCHGNGPFRVEPAGRGDGS